MATERSTPHPKWIWHRITACALILCMIAALLVVSSPTFAEDTANETPSSLSSSAIITEFAPTGENPASEVTGVADNASSGLSEDGEGPDSESVTAEDAFPQSEENLSTAQAEENSSAPTESAEALPASQEEAEQVVALSDENPYTGGTIPILRFTCLDDINPETHEVVTGDEIIALVNESADHSYRATSVVCDLVVPEAYDNPESDMLDGNSSYSGASNLSLEFFRGRGNSTWRNDKKPYKFKLEDPYNFFGMGANKHWVLLANAYDKSLSIDRIIGWIGEQMGLSYTPRGVPVDLFMNDEYYGSYLLMEEVRIGDNRVDIDEVPKSASNPDSSAITGGYLFGVSWMPDSTEDEIFRTSRGTIFSYETPEFTPPLSEARIAQQAYLKSYLDRVEAAVYGKGFVNDDGESVWDLMDRDSLADYWWIQEFSCNRDAFATPSTYLYKVRDDKLYWGPLWDFDYVWGGMEVEGFDNTNASAMPWIERLRSDPDFVSLLEERWQKLDGALVELTKEHGLIDQYIEELDDSWTANDEIWHAGGTDMYGWKDGSCAEALNELRNRIEERRAWINDHLGELQTVFRTLTFMDGDDIIFSEEARAGYAMNPDAPDAPEKDGLLFDGWFTDDGQEYDCDVTYKEDTVFHATYVDPASVTAATSIYFATPEIWISYPRNLGYDLVPADAKDTRITWSSSDENVVTVDGNGRVYPADGCLDGRETAEAVVTAHLLGSGIEASVRIIVYDPDAKTLPQPESITFDENMVVKVGEYKQLEFTSEPVPNTLFENFNLNFSVEDEGIATTTSTGVVHGKSPGTTTILIQRLDPDTQELQTVATVSLTVTEGESGGGGSSTYTITYKLNGGSINGKTDDVRVQCKAGDAISILKAPVRDGYTFQYWKGSRYQPGDKYTVRGDHTFTAVWKQNATSSPGSSRLGNNASQHSSGTTSNSPRTGDSSDPIPFIVAALAAAIAFVSARFMRIRS